MASLLYVIKIKQVLFSKLTYCVYQVTFFYMKCPVKRRVLNIWKKLLFFNQTKRWLISNYNSVANLYNKNKASAIFKTHVLCLSSNFLLHEMSCKKENIIPKKYIYMLGKCCCSSKKLLVTHGQKYLLRKLLCHTTRNIMASL